MQRGGLVARPLILGMAELKKQFKKLEKIPQGAITKSTRKGARIGLKEIKSRAPVDSGDLKKGLKIYAEKTRKKGKKVFDIRFDRNMNDVFVKYSKEGKRSYYPTSQEYGFFARDNSYIPGYRFMRSGLESKKKEIEREIVESTIKDIKKITGR